MKTLVSFEGTLLLLTAIENLAYGLRIFSDKNKQLFINTFAISLLPQDDDVNTGMSKNLIFLAV